MGVRIVALTANAFPADRDACFAAGIDAFVAKPLDQARLAAALGPAALPTATDMRQPA
jgi:CheY-like chemotaxis protein